MAINIFKTFYRLPSWRLLDFPMFKAGYMAAINDLIDESEKGRSKYFPNLDTYISQGRLKEIKSLDS